MKTQTAITTEQDPEALAWLNNIMTQAGQSANQAGARVAFANHTARKADNTIMRKRGGISPGELVKPLGIGCYRKAMQLAVSTGDYPRYARTPGSPRELGQSHRKSQS